MISGLFNCDDECSIWGLTAQLSALSLLVSGEEYHPLMIYIQITIRREEMELDTSCFL